MLPNDFSKLRFSLSIAGGIGFVVGTGSQTVSDEL